MIFRASGALYLSTHLRFFTTLEDQWDEEMGRMDKYQRISYAIFCFF
jgi:hypothetical protein